LPAVREVYPVKADAKALWGDALFPLTCAGVGIILNSVPLEPLDETDDAKAPNTLFGEASGGWRAHLEAEIGHQKALTGRE
jgi:hypothetical protein